MKRAFNIEMGSDTTVVKGRQTAVRTARELSTKTWRPVRIKRADDKMEMVFRNGKMTDFMLSLRGRR